MTAAGHCSPPADPCKTDGVSPLPRPPGILKARTEYFCTGFFHRVSFAMSVLVLNLRKIQRALLRMLAYLLEILAQNKNWALVQWTLNISSQLPIIMFVFLP